ncbi:MAG: N-acetylmuramoyl-L-alanine amidase, partial [Pricia sp.]|nr:N-acetylmuramoyl-L-alanine amidase [Pricia sp.]
SKAHGAGTFVLGLHANKQNFEIAKKENSVIYLEDDYQSRYADYDINSPESVIGLTIMQEEFLDQSIALAKNIQDNFAIKLKRNDRKVKQAGFIVLHQTFMPSVLVETGFLTNKEEGAYLNSKKGQSQMGTAIAEAIYTYKQNAMANIADAQITEIPDVPEPNVSNKKEEESIKIASANTEKIEEVTENDKTTDSQTSAASADKAKELTAGKEKAAAEIIEEARTKSEVSSGSSETTGKELADASEVGVISKKEEPIKTKKIRSPEPKSNVIYKVQIMASAKNIPLRPESFNGLNRVAKEPYKNLFRYVYGSTRSLDEAKMMKSNADLKGYTTSYIVAYRNGVRIPFKESLK